MKLLEIDCNKIYVKEKKLLVWRNPVWLMGIDYVIFIYIYTVNKWRLM